MEYNSNVSNGRIELGLSGELTFTDTEQFNAILKDVGGRVADVCIVDFHRLQFIDSSGLRMLLLLHDLTKEKGMKLEFHGTTGEVRERITHARFDLIVSIIG